MKENNYSKTYTDWENRLKNGASENWLSILENSIFDWKKSAELMEKDLESNSHSYDAVRKVQLRKDIRQRRELVEQLSELFEKYENFEVEKYLSDECISDLEKLAAEEPDLVINTFFNAAHSQFPSCRKNIEGKKISFGTLRDRTKEVRPDIYYRNIKPRK